MNDDARAWLLVDVFRTGKLYGERAGEAPGQAVPAETQMSREPPLDSLGPCQSYSG